MNKISVHAFGSLLQFPHPGMGELLVRAGIILVVALTCSKMAQAESHGAATGQDLPSAEMLEFLGDLDPVDEETWQLLEHHALKDVAQKNEVNSE